MIWIISFCVVTALLCVYYLWLQVLLLIYMPRVHRRGYVVVVGVQHKADLPYRLAVHMAARKCRVLAVGTDQCVCVWVCARARGAQVLKSLAAEPLADGGGVQTMHVSTYAHMDELKERASLLLHDDHLWALVVCVPPNTAAVGNATWLGCDSYWTSAVDNTLMMCVRTMRVFGAMLRTHKGRRA
jgi:hypothetical protein